MLLRGNLTNWLQYVLTFIKNAKQMSKAIEYTAKICTFLDAALPYLALSKAQNT